MKRLFAFAAAMLVSAAAFAQQQDFSKVEIKVQKVQGSVYMLTGAGGNIGVCVGDDGIVIVDDQFAPLAPKIKEALKSISTKPIKFIINTHYHGDHTGGNEIFGREGTIIAHDNTRKRMEFGTKVLGTTIPPAPKGALPVVTFAALLFVALLNGSIIVETVFGWPGLGLLVIEAVDSRDYPIVQTVVLFLSAMYIGVNLIVDVLYAVINPTIRYR